MSSLIPRDLYILSYLNLEPIPQGKTGSYFINVGKKHIPYRRADKGFFERARYEHSEADRDARMVTFASKVEWFVSYSRDGRMNTEALPDRGWQHRFYCSYKFTKPGTYTIWCRIYVGGEKPVILDTTNTVAPTLGIHKKVLARQKKSLPNPGEVRDDMEREAKVLGILWSYGTTNFPKTHMALPTNENFIDYWKRVAQIASYIQASDKLFDFWPYLEGKGKGKTPFTAEMLHPIRASWVSSTHTAKHFVPRLAYAVDMVGDVVLHHWTNPEAQGLHGRYVGKKGTKAEKLEAAIHLFENECGFPKGHMMIEVPRNRALAIPAREFSTDTPKFRGFWRETAEGLADLMSKVALAATAVALFTAPIPGGRVASAALFTAMLSGSVEAIAKISRRRLRGRRDFRGDAIDVLTLAASLFAAGGIWAEGVRAGKWKRGATLVHSELAQELAFVGRISGEVVEGVLVIPDQVAEFKLILDDPDMSPVERLARLGKLAVESKALPVAFSDVRKRGNLKAMGLGVDGKTLKLGDGVPVMKSKTQDGTMVVHVHEGRRKFYKGAKPWGRGMKSSKHPNDRAMSYHADHVFKKIAKGKNQIILVIDTNPKAMKWMDRDKISIGGQDYALAPKPMDVKGKSLSKGEYAGLASASADKKLGEGFRLLKDPPLVVRDKPPPPTIFYSDYDLHGVYDAKTGESAFDAAWQKKTNFLLNKLGGVKQDMILHPARDLWSDRLDPAKAKDNYGPIGHMKDGSVTAYTPDGSFRLESVADLEKFYRDHGLDWDKIWKPPSSGWRK